MIKEIWFELNGSLTLQTLELLEAQDALCFEAYVKAIHRPLSDAVKNEYRDVYKGMGADLLFQSARHF